MAAITNDDVKQELALEGLVKGRRMNHIYTRYKLRRRERAEQLKARDADQLVCGRGLATETLIDLEGIDQRTFLVARLLAEGHRDGEVRRLLDMGRDEFECRRDVLREMYS